MKYNLIWIMGLMLLITVAGALAAMPDGWRDHVVVDNKAILDMPNYYISVYPAERVGSGWVEIEFNTSVSIPVRFVVGNNQEFDMTRVQWYNPQNTQGYKEYYCDGSSTLLSNASHFRCTLSNGTIDYQGTHFGDYGNRTFNISYEYVKDWQEIPYVYRKTREQFDGKNHWIASGVFSPAANTNYKIRVWLDLSNQPLYTEIKYDFGFVDATYNNINDAITDGRFWAIDPTTYNTYSYEGGSNNGDWDINTYDGRMGGLFTANFTGSVYNVTINAGKLNAGSSGNVAVDLYSDVSGGVGSKLANLGNINIGSLLIHSSCTSFNDLDNNCGVSMTLNESYELQNGTSYWLIIDSDGGTGDQRMLWGVNGASCTNGSFPSDYVRRSSSTAWTYTIITCNYMRIEQSFTDTPTTSINISNIAYVPLNSSLSSLQNWTSDYLQEIEYGLLTFDVNTTGGLNISESAFNFTANGTDGCSLGNKQSSHCFNYTDTIEWIEWINNTETNTFNGTWGNSGDFINISWTGNDTDRSYTVYIDEHYNPNVFKHYEALYDFDDVKYQTGVNQRIQKSKEIMVTDPGFVPASADAYKIDFRVQIQGTPQALQIWLCNSTYPTVNGSVEAYPGCQLVTTRSAAQINAAGGKVRGIFGNGFLQALGDINTLHIRSPGTGPANYYSIKTYAITNATHTQKWLYSTNNGTTYSNLGDGYETEANINWVTDGASPTGIVFNILANATDGTQNTYLYSSNWDVNATFNYPPIVEINAPENNESISFPYNITFNAADSNNDELNITLYLYNSDGTLNKTLASGMNQSNTSYYWNDTVEGTFNITIVAAENATSELYSVNDTHIIYINTKPSVTTPTITSQGGSPNYYTTRRSIDASTVATDTDLDNMTVYLQLYVDGVLTSTYTEYNVTNGSTVSTSFDYGNWSSETPGILLRVDAYANDGVADSTTTTTNKTLGGSCVANSTTDYIPNAEIPVSCTFNGDIDNYGVGYTDGFTLTGDGITIDGVGYSLSGNLSTLCVNCLRYGLSIHETDNINIYNLTLDNWINDLYVNSSNNTKVYNSNITSGLTLENPGAVSNASLFMINTTVDVGSVTVNNANTRAYIQWYVDAIVYDTLGSALNNVNVSYVPLGLSATPSYTLTNSSGEISQLILSEYEVDSSATDSFNNWRFNGSLTSYTSLAVNETNISGNTNIIMYLSANPTDAAALLLPETPLEADSLLAYCKANDTDSSLSFNYTLYKNDAVNKTGSYVNYTLQETYDNVSEWPGGVIYLNYSKLSGATSAYWQVKHGTLDTYNISVPDSCFDYSSVLMFRIEATINSTRTPDSITKGYCYNGTWQEIASQTGTGSIGTGSVTNGTTAYDGDYSTYAYYFDIGVPEGWSQSAGAPPEGRWYEEAVYWITPTTTNSTDWILIDTLSDTGDYGDNWTLSCTAYDGISYSSAANSSTIGVSNYTYNSTIYETQTAQFNLSIVSSLGDVNATFIYNGTAQSVTKTGSAPYYNFTADYIVPFEPNNGSVYNWTWNWTYTNSTGGLSEDNTSGNQTVYQAYNPLGFSLNDSYLVETDYAYFRYNATNIVDEATTELIVSRNGTNSSFSLIDSGTLMYVDSYVTSGLQTSNVELYNYTPTLKLTHNGNTIYREFTSQTQDVYKMVLDTCGTITNTTSINFTFVDADTGDPINLTSLSGANIEVYKTDDALYREYTFNFEGLEYEEICIYPSWAELEIDYTLTARATNYSTLTTSANNVAISNTTKTIETGLLASGDTEAVNIHVLDMDDTPYTNYNVYAYLYNSINNSYTLIGSDTTDFTGTVVFNLDVTDKKYSFNVTNTSGDLVYSTTPFKIAYTDYYFRIARLVDDDYTFVTETGSNLTYNFTADNTTGYFNLTWNDQGSVANNVCLRVYNNTAGGNVIISSECSNSDTGSFQTSVGTTTDTIFNAVMIVQASSTSQYYVWDTRRLDFTDRPPLGTDGLILGFLIVGTAFSLGLWKPAVGIILGSGAFILISIMGLMPFSGILGWGGIMVMAVVAIALMRQ